MMDGNEEIVARIYELLAAAGFDEQQSNDWLTRPNDAFGGQTPQSLIDDGKANEVRSRLEALALGDVGG